jgi:SAM-dependent methyltransferase
VIEKNLNLKRLNEKAWFQIHKQGPYTQYPSSDAIGFFKNIKNKYNKSVLELGCASGNMQVFFRKEGFDSYGIDLSKEAINFAKKLLKNNKLFNGHLFCQDMTDLHNQKNNFFDIIFDYNSISCLPLYLIEKTFDQINLKMKTFNSYNKIKNLTDYYKIINNPKNSRGGGGVLITNLYSKKTKIKNSRMINKNTIFVNSAGKTRNYTMTLFNFSEAKNLLNKKNFKIIHHEKHSLEIPSNNFYFEKYTFYCIKCA